MVTTVFNLIGGGGGLFTDFWRLFPAFQVVFKRAGSQMKMGHNKFSEQKFAYCRKETNFFYSFSQ